MIEPRSEADPCLTGRPVLRMESYVGVREHGPDDGLGLRHYFLRRSVVDAQGSEVDLVEADNARAVPATTP